MSKVKVENNFYDYFDDNKPHFSSELFNDLSDEFKRSIDHNALLKKKHLLETAELLVRCLGDNSKLDLLSKEAQKRGEDWGNSKLDISLKLEYFKSFRSTYCP